MSKTSECLGKLWDARLGFLPVRGRGWWCRLTNPNCKCGQLRCDVLFGRSFKYTPIYQIYIYRHVYIYIYNKTYFEFWLWHIDILKWTSNQMRRHWGYIPACWSTEERLGCKDPCLMGLHRSSFWSWETRLIGTTNNFRFCTEGCTTIDFHTHPSYFNEKQQKY